MIYWSFSFSPDCSTFLCLLHILRILSLYNWGLSSQFWAWLSLKKHPFLSAFFESLLILYILFWVSITLYCNSIFTYVFLTKLWAPREQGLYVLALSSNAQNYLQYRKSIHKWNKWIHENEQMNVFACVRYLIYLYFLFTVWQTF